MSDHLIPFGKNKKKDEAPKNNLPLTRKSNEILDDIQSMYVSNCVSLFDESLDSVYANLSAIAPTYASDEKLTLAFKSIADRKTFILDELKVHLGKLVESSFNGSQIKLKTAAKGLSLVSNDTLEEKIVISDMCDLAIQDADEMIQHTYMRIEFLMKSQDMESQFNPLLPEVFGQALVDVVQDVCESSRVRQLFFSGLKDGFFSNYFYVLGDLNDFMHECNVLPNLQETIAMNRRKAQRGDILSTKKEEENPISKIIDQAKSKTANYEPDKFTPAEGVNHLDSIDPTELNSVISNLIKKAKSEGKIEELNSPDSIDKDEIEQEELLEVLNKLQKKTTEMSDMIDLDAEVQSEDTKKQIRRLIAKEVNEGEDKKLGTLNEEIINTIGLMFEFILDDITLPVELKPILIRLQIPFLKIAMTDDDFFKAGDHPARKLLNMMAKVGVTLGESQDILEEIIYKKIDEVVMIIIMEFSKNHEIFKEQFDIFELFANKYMAKSNNITQRIAKNAEGNDKILESHTIVVKDIKIIIENSNSPAVIKMFAKETWSNLMQTTYIKSGISDEYNLCNTLIERLVWSIQEERVEERNVVSGKMKEVLLDIRNLLADRGISMKNTQEHLDTIEGIQDRILAGKSPHTLEQNGDRKKSIFEAMQFLHEEDNIDLDRKGEQEYDDWVDTTSDQKELTDEVIELFAIGRWIEFLKDGKSVERLKVGVMLKFKQKVILVTNKGIKSREEDINALFSMYGNKEIRLLDDNHLFERAMNSMIDKLQE